MAMRTGSASSPLSSHHPLPSDDGRRPVLGHACSPNTTPASGCSLYPQRRCFLVPAGGPPLQARGKGPKPITEKNVLPWSSLSQTLIKGSGRGPGLMQQGVVTFFPDISFG